MSLVHSADCRSCSPSRMSFEHSWLLRGYTTTVPRIHHNFYRLRIDYPCRLSILPTSLNCSRNSLEHSWLLRGYTATVHALITFARIFYRLRIDYSLSARACRLSILPHIPPTSRNSKNVNYDFTPQCSICNSQLPLE